MTDIPNGTIMETKTIRPTKTGVFTSIVRRTMMQDGTNKTSLELQVVRQGDGKVFILRMSHDDLREFPQLEGRPADIASYLQSMFLIVILDRKCIIFFPKKQFALDTNPILFILPEEAESLPRDEEILELRNERDLFERRIQTLVARETQLQQDLITEIARTNELQSKITALEKKRHQSSESCGNTLKRSKAVVNLAEKFQLPASEVGTPEADTSSG